MVAIIDYGVGNLLAIQNIIRKVGGNPIITNKAEEIEKADKLILPGVGAFGFGMEQLSERRLIGPLRQEVLVKGKVVLGLCLGAQLMTQWSEEGSVEGLGWVQGRAIKFDKEKVRVAPHMGWSDVDFIKSTPFTEKLDNSRFYFAHSYHFSFDDLRFVTGWARYGYAFPCSFQKDNIFGVQFHPEKSHKFGMKLFENFLRL